MRDQAEKLREKLKLSGTQMANTIAVVSGKGGVGKSNVSINMSLFLSKQGKKVLLFDFDIGMGNVQVLLGESAPKSISDYIYSTITLKDIICQGPCGLSYISAGNGFSEIVELNAEMLERLLRDLEQIQNLYDYIIFDMGAGASHSNLQVILSVDDIFVVTTPEPTSITDAYSMMKYITLLDESHSFYILCNRADKEREGLDTIERLQAVMKKFLNKDIAGLGVLQEDSHVRKAVLRQKPFLLEYPNARINQELAQFMNVYLGRTESNVLSKSHFISKLRHLFMKGRT
jgi:flagellar biosynthesis protein FlhG